MVNELTLTTWTSLAIFSVPDVDRDDTQLFLFFSSSVELTLTSLACGCLACGSLAHSFKTAVIVYRSIY